MKKHLKAFIIFTSILCLFSFILPSCVFASSIFGSINVNSLNLNSIDPSKIDELKNTIENIISNENLNNNTDKNTNYNKINMNSVIEVYKELSKVISNEEMASLINDNKDILSNAGANKKLLSKSSTILKTFDPNTVVDILQNDLNLSENSEYNKSSLQLAFKSTSFANKIIIIFKLLFSNEYFRLFFVLSIVVSIYSIYITSIIFQKAGKPNFATIIPIYRDIIHLKLCNFSPWFLILIFIPIIGWLALMSIAVVGRFELSRNFGHGFLFGLGLLFLPIVFRSYLAFSKDEYIGEK